MKAPVMLSNEGSEVSMLTPRQVDLLLAVLDGEAIPAEDAVIISRLILNVYNPHPEPGEQVTVSRRNGLNPDHVEGEYVGTGWYQDKVLYTIRHGHGNLSFYPATSHRISRKDPNA